MNSICKEKNGIIYEVDYRTELLSIILILSDDYKKLVRNKMPPLNNKFIYENVLKLFGQYKNHNTIKLFNELIRNIEKIALNCGIKCIEVQAFTNNIKSTNLYQKNKFNSYTTTFRKQL